MVDIYLKEEFYAYDAFHIIKGFLPNEEIKPVSYTHLTLPTILRV